MRGFKSKAEMEIVTKFKVKFENRKELEEKVGCDNDIKICNFECGRCKLTAEQMEVFENLMDVN